MLWTLPAIVLAVFLLPIFQEDSRKTTLSSFLKCPLNFLSPSITSPALCEASLVLYAKEFSFSTDESFFRILKQGVTAGVIKSQTHVVSFDSKFKAQSVSLAEVKFAQHQTKRGYLMHIIIHSYYAGYEQMKSDFFKNWACHNWFQSLIKTWRTHIHK